jgi:hypothetical protein
MAAKSTLIPTLDVFKANPSILATGVKNDIIRFKKENPKNVDNDNVITKLSQIIGYLETECLNNKQNTVTVTYRTVCTSRLGDYRSFLASYQAGSMVGGSRRKTMKGRRKNKSRRNRKSRR